MRNMRLKNLLSDDIVNPQKKWLTQFEFYDNGGQEMSRCGVLGYRYVVLDLANKRGNLYDAYLLSDHPFAENGVREHGQMTRGPQIGTRRKFIDLPDDVQQAVEKEYGDLRDIAKKF